VLSAAAVGGAYWRYHWPDPLAGLELVTAKRGDIVESVTALGKLHPREDVDVGAQVSGQLKRITVHVGDKVEAGTLLAEIDPQLQLAKLEIDRAQVAQLEAERDVQRLQVELADAQHQRQLRLRSEGATREDAVEQAQSAVRMATAKLASIDAQLRQARLTTKADDALLGFTRIFAPISGTVVSVEARLGQTLIASQQVPLLMRIADLTTMTVWAQVSEVEVARLRPGMALYFSTLGQPTRKLAGTLRQLLPAPAKPPAAPGAAAPPASPNSVVQYTALFDVDNRTGELRPEMSVQVSFVVAEAKDALSLPEEALLAPMAEDAQTGEVSVLGAGGARETRRLKLGIHNRFEVQVLEGLAEGERVVKRTPPKAETSENPL
jgi:macrolide-specific efflux system membrane fusion protein